jgi:hypothetical protein
VFGTINIVTGHRLFLARKRQRGEDFRAFLRVIDSHYRGWHVALLLDEDPSHTAGDSEGLARELGIKLIWLPKRCPELNGMDHLWGHGKDHMCANKQYETIDGEVHASSATSGAYQTGKLFARQASYRKTSGCECKVSIGNPLRTRASGQTKKG